MLRSPSTRKAQRDPATEARLATLRSTFNTLTTNVDALAASQKRAHEVAASKARAAQVRHEHTRLQSAEDAHRASDRTFFLRPLPKDAADLWSHAQLREWYGGAERGSMDTSAMPDFGRTQALGQTLRQTGYVIPADTSRAALGETANPYATNSPRQDGAEVAMNTARAAALGTWRANANRAHWLDREAVLQVEQQSARDMLGATGWRPDMVATQRPFKARTAAEDGWRFSPPPPDKLKADLERTRVAGAREGVGNAAASHATGVRMMASRPGFYW